MKPIILFSCLATLLTGCSMTGYGGSSSFRCRNDLGNSQDPYCTSISSNYNASLAGTLGADSTQAQVDLERHKSVLMLQRSQVLESGTPVRSQSEVARIWIAPYLDNDGDLVDMSYTYLTLNQGRWLIEHNEQQIVDTYRPIRLLGSGKVQQVDTVDADNTANNNTPANTDKQGSVPDIGMTLDQLK